MILSSWLCCTTAILLVLGSIAIDDATCTAFVVVVGNSKTKSNNNKIHHWKSNNRQQQQQLSFINHHHHQRQSTIGSGILLLNARGPSRVIDEDGPTPPPDNNRIDVVDPKDLKELYYDPNEHPIPHQPWRRGITYGCEDPIDATWRQTAEYLIKSEVSNVGGKVIDITWYLTSCLIHLDTHSLQNVEQYTTGPEITVRWANPDGTSKNGPIFIDPSDPKPDDIVLEGDDSDTSTPFVYQRDTELEKELEDKKYRPYDNNEYKWGPAVDNKDPDETDEELGIFPKGSKMQQELDNTDPGLYMKNEVYADTLGMTDEERVRIETAEQRYTNIKTTLVDTAALSTISRVILKVLEDHDDELDILDRHEIILANYLSPTDPYLNDMINPQYIPGLLQCQKDFDNAKGKDVAVYTKDPYDSNRTLKGKLIERNSMDIYINKKGRVVTIPQNFVTMVILRHADEMISADGRKSIMPMTSKAGEEWDNNDDDEEEENEEDIEVKLVGDDDEIDDFEVAEEEEDVSNNNDNDDEDDDDEFDDEDLLEEEEVV